MIARLLVFLSATLVLGQTNLLTNNGFESDLTGWQTRGPAEFSADTAQPHSGQKAARIYIASGTTLNYQQIYGTASSAITEGERYSASVWVRSQDVTTAPGAYFYIEFQDYSGNRVSIVDKTNGVTAGAMGWEELRIDSALVPAGASKLQIGFVLHATGTAWFDDASCVRVFAPAASLLRVRTDSVICRDFLGVNGTYHGFAYMPEQTARGMDSADRAREFNRVSAMGFNIARTWYRPDWACGTAISNVFDWNSVKMNAFYQWLAAMKALDVDVALQLGWWLSDAYLGSTLNLAADTLRFAEWVSASVREIVVNRGFTNVKYGILFTEPTSSYAGGLPDYPVRWDYYRPLIRAIHNRLTADGLRSLLKLVGPNNTGDGEDLSRAVADLNDVIDIYSGHNYNKTGYDGWYAMCVAMQATVRATGKPFWLDEYGKQDEVYRATADYGTYVAEAVAASLNAGNQSSVIWLLFDQLYVAPGEHWNGSDAFHDGVHRWGTCKWPHDAITNPTLPYPSYYAFGLLSRYLPARCSASVCMTEGRSGIRCAAVKTPSGDVSLLLVNSNTAGMRFKLILDPPLNNLLKRYSYDPAHITSTEAAIIQEADSVFPIIADTLSDSLPPRGVVIYTTKDTSGNTPDEKKSAAGEDQKKETTVACIPNPFNPCTQIRYSLALPQTVEVAVFNISGQMVRLLVSKTEKAGVHSVEWDGCDQQDRRMSSGVYLIKLKTGNKEMVRRAVLIR